MDVEAAYLYNFGKFVTWPAASSARSLEICVLGSDPFGQTLDRVLANEQIEGRPLEALRLADISAAAPCSILYISSSEAPHLSQDLAAVVGMPVLTVSALPDFANRGGAIQFVLRDNRVRFEVNLEAVQKSGLVLSSQLLKVALHVIGDGGEKTAQ